MAISAFIYFARPLYLPDALFIKQLESRLSAAFGMQLEIGGGSFRLLRDARLEDIAWCDSTGHEVLTIDTLYIRYKLTSLLNRTLIIDNLSVVHPRYYYKFTQESVKNISPTSLTTPEETGLDSSQNSNVPVPPDLFFQLPVRLEIVALEVVNGEIGFATNSTELDAEILSKSISISGENIYFKDSQDFFAQYNIENHDSLEMILCNETLKIRAKSPFSLLVEGQLSPTQCPVKIRTKLQPLIKTNRSENADREFSFPELSLSAKVGLRNYRNLLIEEMQIQLGTDANISAGGEIKDIFGNPEFVLEIIESQASIEHAMSIYEDISELMGWDTKLEETSASGIFKIYRSNLKGNINGGDPEILLSLICEIVDASLSDDDMVLELDGIGVKITGEGCIFPIEKFGVETEIGAEIESILLPNIKNDIYKLSGMRIDIDAGVDEGWRNPRFGIDWAGSVAGDLNSQGHIVIRADSLNLREPFDSPELYAEGGGSVEKIRLTDLLSEQFAGEFSSAFEFKYKELNNIDFSMGLFCPDLQVRYMDDILSFPPLMARTSSRLAISPDLDRVEAAEFSMDTPPYLNGDFSAFIADDGSWAIRDLSINFDLGEICTLFRPFLRGRVEGFRMGGSAILSGKLQGELGSGGFSVEQNLIVHGDAMTVKLPDYEIEMDSIALKATLRGDLDQVATSGELSIGSALWTDHREEAYHQVAATWENTIDIPQKVVEGWIGVRSEELGLNSVLEGKYQLTDDGNRIDGVYKVGFDRGESVNIFDGLNISGNLATDGEITYSSDSDMYIKGNIDCQKMNINYADEFEAKDFDLFLPYSFSIPVDAEEENIAGKQKSSGYIPDPVIYGANEHLFMAGDPHGKVKCDILKIGEYEGSNLEGTLVCRNNMLESPGVSASAYEGDLHGSFSIDFTNIDLDSLRYQIQLSALELNTALLPGTKDRNRKDSKISAFARVRGQGLDWQENFNIEGSLDITRIGRQVADNLLTFVDPDQSNPSIQTYRKYLKRGWGVKLFSFEVKDDFVYTSIIPAKPPISKPDMFLLSRLIGMGKSVTFGRVPVKFFLSRPNVTD